MRYTFRFVRYRYHKLKLCLPPRRLEDVFKICLQGVFKTSSRRLQDAFSVTIFRLPRRLQDVLQDVFKTFSRTLQDVFARRLQDVLEDEKLLHWRRVEDVFKTCLEDVLKTPWRPTNVYWVLTYSTLYQTSARAFSKFFFCKVAYPNYYFLKNFILV